MAKHHATRSSRYACSTLLLSSALALSTGCVLVEEDESADVWRCPAGEQGCACLPNAECDDGLACSDGECVPIGNSTPTGSGGSGAGGTGDTGGSAAGGTSGSGGSYAGPTCAELVQEARQCLDDCGPSIVCVMQEGCLALEGGAQACDQTCAADAAEWRDGCLATCVNDIYYTDCVKPCDYGYLVHLEQC